MYKLNNYVLRSYILSILSSIFGIALLTGCHEKVKPQATAPEPVKDSTEVVQQTIKEQSFSIEQIDSVTYLKAVAGKLKPFPSPKAITNYERAKELLKGRVEFDDSTQILTKVKFKSGSSYTNLGDYNGELLGFVAYYPQVDILELESGHSLEVGIHLADRMENIGVPQMQFYSNDRNFRLSGYFGGQEIDILNLYELTSAGRYRQIAELSDLFEPVSGTSPVSLVEACWTDNTTLYIRMSNGSNASIRHFLFYKISMPITKPIDTDSWNGLPQKSLPYNIETLFDEIGTLPRLNNKYVKALGLSLLYPGCKFYQGVRLPLSSHFTTILVPIESNPQEFNIHLFNIDSTGSVLDDLSIGYDEIAESAFRHYCILQKKGGIITEENDFQDQKQCIATFHWTQKGRLIVKEKNVML